MKIVQLINQNIPIWSILSGDHALAGDIDKINPRLLKTPDFLNALENKLRLEVFKERRGWIYDTMKDQASFALVKIDMDELLTYKTCFTGVSFQQFVDEYQRAYKKGKGFVIKRPRHETDLDKDKAGVLNVADELANKIEIAFNKSSYKLKPEDVLNPVYRNEDNIYTAANRGFVMRPKHGGALKILDGTHRLTAYSI
jgi:hypothetical protein